MKNKWAYIVEIIVGSVILLMFLTIFIMKLCGCDIPNDITMTYHKMEWMIFGYLGHSTLSRKRQESRDKDKGE